MVTRHSPGQLTFVGRKRAASRMIDQASDSEE